MLMLVLAPTLAHQLVMRYISTCICDILSYD